jgi:hypothetical protein
MSDLRQRPRHRRDCHTGKSVEGKKKRPRNADRQSSLASPCDVIENGGGSLPIGLSQPLSCFCFFWRRQPE